AADGHEPDPPPDAGVAEVVRVARARPHAGAKVTALVELIGFECLELPVGDGLVVIPDPKHQYAQPRQCVQRCTPRLVAQHAPDCGNTDDGDDDRLRLHHDKEALPPITRRELGDESEIPLIAARGLAVAEPASGEVIPEPATMQ